MSSFHIGQRLSTKGNRCTVRYVGEVQGKPGEWLGIEWDDPSRGKHSGTHQGVEYFKCRSSSPTAASFIRPSAPWETPRTFLEALKSKYAAAKADTDIAHDPQIEFVRISGKKAEEVGFDKIARQQAQLQNLRIVVLDGMLLKHDIASSDALLQTCPSITDLDLGRNLLETITEIADVCAQLNNLCSLKLNGNRLREIGAGDEVLSPNIKSLERIRSLDVDNMLLDPSELNELFARFPKVSHISASANDLDGLHGCTFPSQLLSITLENNNFTCLEDISSLGDCCQQLRSVNLKNNRITSTRRKGSSAVLQLPESLEELDLSYNNASSWDLINDLLNVCPGLKHLRISHNPLFQSLRAADDKPLTSADGYMLTIARLPGLKTLNYSTISAKDRLNAETYYLSQIAGQISRAPTAQEGEIIAQHPRYRDLCEEYGEPRIERKEENTIDPNSLAARLLKCNFFSHATAETENLPSRGSSCTIELPKSVDVYTVMGIVGQKFNLLPMRLRLFWETGEKERVKRPSNTWASVQEWDSSDEEADEVGDEWREREVELLQGTRPLGTWIESSEAMIRVELKPVPTS